MIKSMGLGCLIENPVNFNFETKQEDETIVLLLRRHWITWLRWIIPSTGVILLPVFLESLVIPGLSPLPPELRFSLRLPLWLLLEAVGVFYLIENFLLWYFTVDIVTTKRIVDINFLFPFYRKVSESSLNRVQDISNVSDGIFQSIFDFGDVRIETAGETSEAQITHSPGEEHPREIAAGVPNFNFHAIPHPDKVQKKILELIGKTRDEKSKTEAV